MRQEPETTIACLAAVAGATLASLGCCCCCCLCSLFFLSLSIFLSCNFLHLVPVWLGVSLGWVRFVFFFLSFFLCCCSFLISLLNWIKKATVINASAQSTAGEEGPVPVLVPVPGCCCCLNQMQNLVCASHVTTLDRPPPLASRAPYLPPSQSCFISWENLGHHPRNWQLENNSPRQRKKNTRRRRGREEERQGKQ